MIRVLICDDHALVRAGVRRLLEAMDGVEVVGESGNADDAVMRARQTLPDIVVLDLSLKGRSGFDALAELRLAVPESQVVILSMHEDVLHVREALSRGALCYVVKDAPPAELEIALRAASTGRTFLSPQVSAPQLRSYRAERAPGDVESLPRRHGGLCQRGPRGGQRRHGAEEQAGGAGQRTQAVPGWSFPHLDTSLLFVGMAKKGRHTG